MDGTGKLSKAEAAEAAPVKEKGSKKVRAPKQVKPAREPKQKREPIPEGEVCVFAFRTSRELREQLHRASGPAGASRFAIGAITAAIKGDRALFDELATKAKSNLK